MLQIFSLVCVDLYALIIIIILPNLTNNAATTLLFTGPYLTAYKLKTLHETQL